MIGLVLSAIVGGVFVLYIAQKKGRPEKQTYLFETENGKKDNPFSDISDGAESDSEYRY